MTNKNIVENLTSLIQEEVERINRIKELRGTKEQLQNALKRLEEGENVDEIWGGLKKVFQKGSQNAVQGAKNTWNQTKKGITSLGQDFVDVGNQAVQGVQRAGQNVANTYKQGEMEADKKAKQNKISNIHTQIKQMLNQYQQLTGKPFNPTVVAGPAQYRKQAPTPPVNSNQQGNSNAAAAE